MTATVLAPPPRWGSDDLTHFIEMCRNNQFATFANKPTFCHLVRIDKCFVKVLDNSVNPRPWFPLQFFHRSHSAYRAACALTMAGQTVEVNALLRLSLESAAYGLYIKDDTARAEVWLSRHDGDDHIKKQRSEFQYSKVKQHILTVSPELGAILDTLYERTIDYGAHPNERGFSSNTQMNEEGDHVQFVHIYLQANGLPLDLALKSTGQVGLWSLRVFEQIYPERWKRLGINNDVIDLMRYF